MKLEILDTKIKLFLEINKDKLKSKEDGTSRFILKSNMESDEKRSSILVLNLNKKHTNFINKTNFKNKILFVEGHYEILKNKKEIPYANINVTRITVHKKEDIVRSKKIKSSIISDFEKDDLKEFEEKYKKFCTNEEMKELIDVLKEKDILQKRIRANKQELHLKAQENRLKKQEMHLKEQERLILKEKRREEREESKTSSPKKAKWYENLEDFIDLDTNNISYSDEVFKKGYISLSLEDLRDKTKDNYVAVKEIDENKYELVMGIKPFLTAKLSNQSVKAYITDLSRYEFIESLNNK